MFTITREIGIDAGHRIQDHGSKCRNPHGHRYTIQAVCEGQELHDTGEQTGMLLDFGFLKEEMMDKIDKPCDHGTILKYDDPLLRPMLIAGGAIPELIDNAVKWLINRKFSGEPDAVSTVEAKGLGDLKMYIVDFTPTAENLAKHWYFLLEPRVKARSATKARLRQIIVWETPNCAAAYPAVGT